MPQAGDSFVVTVLQVHLGWGAPPGRISASRRFRNDEAYIKIPKRKAREFNIFNSNKTDANILYNVTCLNGRQIDGQLLAQGCSSAGDVYAKQFSVHGDLREINTWYESVNANVGGHVRVVFTSPTDLTIEYF